ncbi:hypothetical protein HUO13_09270 [Saccharopolyspora erythraea]|uniref:DUF6777 domain-containing protein n=1 Tax=Saccharopolyspora erythraea TaxID=1836 RepID=UPI001BAD3721|nr:DUF6777 domain-containing protein [Saccharopolyspora erythraea]QUH00986.1 hypothetical protein HUO13_09270 [Saccharopolyspora erythraea]
MHDHGRSTAAPGEGPTGHNTARTPRPKFTITVAAVLALGLAGGAAWALMPGRTPVRQVSMESSSSPGDTPFVAPISDNGADTSSCDANYLISDLEADPDKARAWAEVFRMSAEEIPGFVSKLTPEQLTSDTPVTSHGYKDGRFDARPTVLQTGTAVFVDDKGEPTVKCLNGNPLTKDESEKVAGSGSGDQGGTYGQSGSATGGQVPGGGSGGSGDNGSGGGGGTKTPTEKELKDAADKAYIAHEKAKENLHKAMDVRDKAWSAADAAKRELDELIKAGATPQEIQKAKDRYDAALKEAKKADEDVLKAEKERQRAEKEQQRTQEAYEEHTGKPYEPPVTPKHPKAPKDVEPQEDKTNDKPEADVQVEPETEVTEETTEEKPVDEGTDTQESEQKPQEENSPPQGVTTGAEAESTQ